MNRLQAVVCLSALVFIASLTACGREKNPDAAGAAGTTFVVASTDVWGSVAQSVAGDLGRVAFQSAGLAHPPGFGQRRQQAP